MRWLAALLAVAACGPTAPQVGTWRYELEATITTAMGTETKSAAFEVDLAASSVSDLVVWRLAGCNIPLAVKGQVAEQSAPGSLCAVNPGAKMPMLDVVGVTPKSNDQVEVKSARFEVLTDGKLKTRFEYKLFTDLKDARVGPLVLVDTPDGKHGTKAK